MTATSPQTPDSRPPARAPSADIARFAGLGFKFAITLVLFGFAGKWLDGKLATYPWLMILGIFAGAALAFYSIVRSVDRTQRPPRT
jgi:F0F1-type ATP synthase assembly protein I